MIFIINNIISYLCTYVLRNYDLRHGVNLTDMRYCDFECKNKKLKSFHFVNFVGIFVILTSALL